MESQKLAIDVLYFDAFRNFSKCRASDARSCFERCARLEDVLSRSIISVWTKELTSVEDIFAAFKRCSEPWAFFMVGQCYVYGFGVAKDVKVAEEFFSKGPTNCYCISGLARLRDAANLLDEAFSLYSKAASLGHLISELYVARMIQKGEGCAPDAKKAFGMLQSLVEKGCAGAVYTLAQCYSNGRGVEKDAQKALRLYLEAAQMGDEYGAWAYASFISKSDPKSAFQWYISAAQREMPEALYAVACCYGNGDGVAQNIPEAQRYCKLAALQGHLDAQMRMADDNPENEAMWLEMAAKQGDQEAMSRLGQIFLQKQDFKNAFAILGMCYESIPQACYLYGLCFLNGWGTEKNMQKAFQLLQESSAKGVVEATVRLGICFKNGDGVPRDLTKAAQLFQVAVNEKHPGAMFYLGRIYENQNDLRRAKELFCMGAELGDDDAAFALASLEEDSTKALPIYLKLSRKGAADAQHNAAMIYIQQKRYAEAIELLSASAAQAYAMAQFQLGCLNFNGQGMPINLPEAVRWFTLAAEQGHSDAQNNLGARYRNGEGVARDATKAVYWFEKSASAGCLEGQFNFGACLVGGDGIQADPTRGCKYYQMAVDRGHVDAMFYLAICYDKGVGVPKNTAKCMELMTQSASKGNNLAKLFLAQKK